MGILLVHEEDVRQIIRDGLKLFESSNLKSASAREAILRKIMEGIKNNGDEIDGQSFLKSHEN